MMMDSKIEKRQGSFALDSADADNKELIVTGYACVFGAPTVLFSIDGIDYKEQIDRHAFDGCDFSQCCFKYNHSNDYLTLARTANGTLQLATDDNGLRCVANLADITAGRDLYALIKRGDISKMSFAFSVSEESYDYDTNTRTVLAIDHLYDVSAVDIPAYDQTSISARDYFKVKIDEKSKIALEARRRLTMQLDLI